MTKPDIIAAGAWQFLSEQKFPEVDTVSGEPNNYACSEDLLIQALDGDICIGWCDICTSEKVWRFYNSYTGNLIENPIAWAEIFSAN